jgi:hypothetical protein
MTILATVSARPVVGFGILGELPGSKEAMTMPETAQLVGMDAKTRSSRQPRLPYRVVVLALALGLIAPACGSACLMLLMGSVRSTAHAQPAEPNKLQLRAQLKSAAEKLNAIASSAPDMIRAMFAGTTTSANLLALDEQSIAAQAELERAALAANEGGALSADEAKELTRLGDLAKKTRDRVKEDIETLKSVPDLPIVGRDAAVRLAPKSQQDAAINNAEAAKQAVGALLAAIRKLP